MSHVVIVIVIVCLAMLLHVYYNLHIKSKAPAFERVSSHVLLLFKGSAQDQKVASSSPTSGRVEKQKTLQSVLSSAHKK